MAAYEAAEDGGEISDQDVGPGVGVNVLQFGSDHVEEPGGREREAPNPGKKKAGRDQKTLRHADVFFLVVRERFTEEIFFGEENGNGRKVRDHDKEDRDEDPGFRTRDR